MTTAFRRILISILVIATITQHSLAQTSKKKRVPTRKTGIIEELDPNYYKKVPSLTDFAFVVNIDKNSNVRVSVQVSETSDYIAEPDSAAENIRRLFSLLPKSVEKPDLNREPIVIIRPDSSAAAGPTIKIIRAIRESTDQRIKLEISKSVDLFIPKAPYGDEFQVKPDPLLLVVSMDEFQNLTLNNEAQGNLKDPLTLINYLIKVFKDRENNAVFREGTNQIEKMVYITVSDKVLMGDIAKLAEKIQLTGADPIGLIVTDSLLPEGRELIPLKP